MLAQQLPVLPLPLPVALASRWQLAVSRGGTALRLHTPVGSFTAAPAATAGSTPDEGGEPSEDGGIGEIGKTGAARPLAGIIHTHHGFELAAALPDRDYKAAEWQALLWAWLHGAPVPVLNRPRAAQVAGAASAGSPAAQRAWWCQRLARAGLPVWLASAADAGVAGERWGLMVAGSRVVQAGGLPLPGWPASTQRRLCALARAEGLDWLALAGREDGQGCWRISRVSTRPDLRPFGTAGAQALAAWLTRHRGATDAADAADAAVAADATETAHTAQTAQMAGSAGTVPRRRAAH